MIFSNVGLKSQILTITHISDNSIVWNLLAMGDNLAHLFSDSVHLQIYDVSPTLHVHVWAN